MAVHVPLSVEAQAECRFLLLSPNNLLKPSDGSPVAVPSQDMVLGIYYLTLVRDEEADRAGVYHKAKGTGSVFKDELEAILAYNNNEVSLHAKIKVRRTIKLVGVGLENNRVFRIDSHTPVDLEAPEIVKLKSGEFITLDSGERIKVGIENKEISKIIDTTVGIITFNEAIPQNLGFVDRTTEESLFKYEIDPISDFEDDLKNLENKYEKAKAKYGEESDEAKKAKAKYEDTKKSGVEAVGKKYLGKIINNCINSCGATKTAAVLDKIKSLGYKYSTIGALTVSVSDMVVPETKGDILKEAEAEVEKVTKMFRRGLMTNEERHRKVVDAWNVANDKLTSDLLEGLKKDNNIFMMAHSGARGSNNQIKQLAGMRGLMASPNGDIIELPIKSNFREGLSVLEYFISAHGARKGLSDTALRTADSGYLTRRLVDVSQDIIIREMDCSEESIEKPGMWVKAFKDGNEVIEPLSERLRGRWSVYDIVNPETGEVIVEEDRMITPEQAIKIERAGIEKVFIRTVLTCRSKIGICSKCYGANMSSGLKVRIGEAVGIIAAQSIGEPGTQLTMRTFHTGGISSADDITQGLPRVEELFEARKPKGLAIITEFSGVAEVTDTKKKREVIVTNNETGESKAYLIPYGSRIKVFDGQDVEAGDELTEGSVNPHDILKIKNIKGVQNYMLQEVQSVYRLQGVDINDKHIEVIVRQMLKRVKIEENGSTNFLPGSLVDWLEFEETNQNMIDQGLEPAKGTRVLLGITKASLATDSFLSAASFQETTRVLTEAAIKGKIDPLIGLKENVIIGKLIPAGTGMQRYRKIELVMDNEA